MIKERPQYLALAEFSSTIAAPLPSPFKCEKGQAVIVDTANKATLSSGAWSTGGVTVSGSDPAITFADVGTKPGTTIIGAILFLARGIQAGLQSIYFSKIGTGNINLIASGQTLLNIPANQLGFMLNIYFIFDSLGCKVLYSLPFTGSNERTSGIRGPFELRLLYVHRGTVDGIFKLARLTGASVGSVLPTFRAINLLGKSALAADYSAATDRQIAPATGATFIMQADSIVDFTWTAALLEVTEIWVRKTDATNAWIVRANVATATIKLIELNAGVETERASAVQVFTASSNYRIVVRCDAAWIRVIVNNATGIEYTSATFNQTASAGLVQGFANSVELSVWPVCVTGLLPAGV